MTKIVVLTDEIGNRFCCPYYNGEENLVVNFSKTGLLPRFANGFSLSSSFPKNSIITPRRVVDEFPDAASFKQYYSGSQFATWNFDQLDLIDDYVDTALKPEDLTELQCAALFLPQLLEIVRETVPSYGNGAFKLTLAQIATVKEAVAKDDVDVEEWDDIAPFLRRGLGQMPGFYEFG